MGSESEDKKIVVNKDALIKFYDKFEQFKEVEVPELSKILNCKNGQVPILKIKAASLDMQIKARELSNLTARAFNRIVDMIRQGNYVDKEILEKTILDESAMHPKTLLEVAVFKYCVVEPEFSIEETVKISEMFPETVNRIAAMSLKMVDME